MSNRLASRSRLAWLAATLLVALLTVPSSAAAQDDENMRQAKKYYKRGMQAFYEDDYAMAITNFKRAHSMSPSGALLFNISLCYSKMAKPVDALEFAQKATEFDDIPKDTLVKNDARMTGYRVAIRGKQITGGSSDRRADAGDDTDTGAGAGTGPGGGAGPPAGSDTNALSWVGVSIGAAGAGLMGGALAVGSSVSSNIEAKRTAEQNGNLGKARDLYESIQSQQTFGQILLYTGMATFAAGTTLFIVDMASSSSSAGTVGLIGGPTRGGFRVGVDLDF